MSRHEGLRARDDLAFIEQQAAWHDESKLTPLAPEVAIATFVALMRRTARLDAALGRDPMKRWAEEKALVARSARDLSDRVLLSGEAIDGR